MRDATKKVIETFLDSLPKGRKYTVKIHRPWWVRLLIIMGTLATALVVILGPPYYYVFQYTGDLVNDAGKPIDLTKPEKADFKKSSIVYANNGEITGRFFYENRDMGKIEEIPDLVKYAFIAAEDKRYNPNRPNKLFPIDYICDPFYVGIDPCAVVRAGAGHLMRIGNASGASGIPSQGVRLYFGDEVQSFRNRDRSYWRKIKEAKLAIQLVKRYPKDKIMEDFLNLIYLGRGANGIAEASQRYFGKNIRKDTLTLQEIAILVSMNKSSAKYSPIFNNPDKSDKDYENKRDKEKLRMSLARDRYNWVLHRMTEDGYISNQDYERSLFKVDADLDESLATLRPLRNRTFEYGNRIIKEFLLSQGRTEKEISSSGGLRVYTTIDPKIQNIASEEFEKHLSYINMEKAPEDMLDGAFIVIEVKTGNILALSGGHNFDETQYNRVFATRSPGSGFKPFVYASALEQGMNYYDKVCNCSFTMRGANGKPWSPRNFKDKNPQPSGYIDLARGVIYSLNLETLNLARSIGMSSVIDTANIMGIHGNAGIVRDSNGNIWFHRPGYEIKGGLDPGLPSAIGASGVNLIELANAYTVFYRNGKYIHPTLIREVRSTYGDSIFKAEIPREKQVISAETAEKMLGLMRAVTKIGTAKISMRNIEQQVACKTGTSNGPKDVSIWCGTPEIFIGIRLGHDEFSKDIELPEYMKKVSGDSTMLPTGGWIVGPLARKIIDRIYADRPKVGFSENIEMNLEELLSHYSRQ